MGVDVTNLDAQELAQIQICRDVAVEWMIG
jgi:hypothetical protein